MKMLAVVLAATAALLMPASAQEAPSVTLKLTMPEVQTVYDALSVQPFNKVSGTIKSVTEQVAASQRPPAEPAKAEPPKADKK